ncbi:S8 family serine peptidase [Fictibacillus iocasae]|uniref:S8 family serine peptidase n=1 Tax=Fictibacillus iocasae TaxID=2715437 RepID=A0ABW2NTG0_9BACL
MKTKWILSAALAVSLLPMNAFTASADETSQRRMKQNIEKQASYSVPSNRQIMIETSSSVTELAKTYGVQAMKTPRILSKKGIYIVKVPSGKNYKRTVEKLNDDKRISSAQPDHTKKILGPVTNDPYFSKQYHLPLTKTTDAWSLVPQENEVIVAVLDSGIDPRHRDLKDRLLPGYDTHGDDSDPSDYVVGHGTAVAGVIAGQANNGAGIAGVAGNHPNVKVLPIRVGGATDISSSNVIEGVYKAIELGADVINLSFGGYDYSEQEYDALFEAYKKGIVIVAASGNEDERVSYPAAFEFVLSAGASDKNDEVTDFSNWGERLDLVAPGAEIWSTKLNNGYEMVDGTSFSAPFVSGVAALMLAKQPDLTPQQIEYLMQKSAVKLGFPFWQVYYGYGRVNTLGAVQGVMPAITGDAGDERTGALPIKLNTSYLDKFHLPWDTDYFKLTVSRKMKIKVDISNLYYMDSVLWIDKNGSGERVIDGTEINEKETTMQWIDPGTYFFQIYENNSHWSPGNYVFKVTEMDTTPPPAPIVNRFDSNDKVMTGKAERKGTIYVKNGTKVIASAKISKTGTFSIPMTVQKAGTTLTVTVKDGAGNVSVPTKVIVKRA